MKTERRFVALVLLVLVCGAGSPGRVSAQAAQNAKKEIVGLWTLESRAVRKANGEALNDPVLGPQPLGQLVYDASGRMMITMMRQGRTEPISTPSNPQDAKNPRVILGYDAYFGTYTVDEAKGMVSHHVMGSLFPEDLGKDFPRYFKIAGDTFTLTFTSKTPDGDVTRTLVFRRSK